MRCAIPQINSRITQCCYRHPIRRLTTESQPEKLPLQEILRRKIWGTDNPPGAPPGSPSPTTDQPPPAVQPTEPDRIGYVEETDGRALPIVGLVPGMTSWPIETFAPQTPPPYDHMQKAVHRAVIEVYTRTLNNLPPTVPHPTTPATPPAAAPVSITVNADGSASFSYPSPETEQSILHGEATPQPPTEQDQDWLNLPFPAAHQPIKFALFKRIYQLTGIKPQDATIPRITTVGKLLDEVMALSKPPPKKLAEVLVGLKEGGELGGNVKVCRGKIRRWDRERGIGREMPLARVVGFRYAFEGVEMGNGRR